MSDRLLYEPRHYPIQSRGVELGIWRDRYQNLELPWLRLTGWENTERLPAKLKEFGVNPR